MNARAPAAVLSPEDRKHFLENGYVALRDCFTTRACQAWKKDAIRRLGCDADNPKTWKEDLVFLKSTEAVVLEQFAPKVLAATAELVGGMDQIHQPRNLSWSNSFVINFRYGEGSAKVNWHKDGSQRHFLDSGEMGLLHYALWSDVGPNGGGTRLALDSIGHVARFLLEHPEGVSSADIPCNQIISRCNKFVNATGQAGDVYLVHPFMLHSSWPNPSGQPRFMTVRIVDLTEPLNFNRANPSAYSLVEQTVLKALGLNQLDFKSKGR